MYCIIFDFCLIITDINGVQSQSGGDIGGTLLRITGTGFGIDREDMEVTVDVDGSSCEVIEHNPTEILCWTTQPSSSNDDDVEQGHRYLGINNLLMYNGDSIDC